MAEVPSKPIDISIDWNEPDEEPDWWAEDTPDEPWTSTGSWSIHVAGIGEVLTDTQYSNDGGFKSLADAVTAAEKWATDRRLDIRLFGVTLRACAQPLKGEG